VSRLVGATLNTPVGPLRAIASESGLCGLPFLPDTRRVPAVNRSRHRMDARLGRWFGGSDIDDDPSDPVLRQTREWLDAYFAGHTNRPLPPLDMRGNDFERRVWAALLDIPIGTTTSYGALARNVGNPSASRAVGLANGANPVPIIVPCHRVIGASGALTGYGGGLGRKAWLLDHERRHWGNELTLQFS
jgi:methylated-DNA-[protein]-cysteine S-methyltransferase